MIFLTIGTQLPFDRLIQIVDDVAPTITRPIFAQIGEGAYRPRMMAYEKVLSPSSFEAKLEACELVISHAGIGTVLGAYRFRKPIVIFPRRASYGEHRNDHQLATCSQLAGRVGLYIAYDEDTLRGLITRTDLEAPDAGILEERRRSFMARLRDYIDKST